MSVPWLCSACRRQLLLPHSPGAQRALFASYSSSYPPSDKKLHDAFFSRRRKLRAEQGQPSKYDQAVENDFFERIAGNHDPGSAPYSSSRSDTVTHPLPPSKTLPPSSSRPTHKAEPISLRSLRSQLPSSSASVADSLGLSRREATPASPNTDFYSSALAALAADSSANAESFQPQVDGLPSQTLPIGTNKDARSPALSNGLQSEEEAPMTLPDALAYWNGRTSIEGSSTDTSPKPLKMAVSKMLASHWCDTSQHQGPTPVELVEWAFENKANQRQRLVLWRECLWSVIHASMQPNPRRSRSDTAAQVVELWTALLRRYGECNVWTADGKIELVHGSADWDCFGDSEEMRQVGKRSTRQLGDRLATFFPDPIRGLLTKGSGHDYELAALASLAYLKSVTASSETTAAEFAPQIHGFIAFMGGLVAQSSAMEYLPTYSKILKMRAFAQSSRDVLLKAISDAAGDASVEASSSDAPSNATRIRDGEQPSVVPAMDWNEAYKKRLGRVLEARNLVHLNQLWSEIKREAEPSGRTGNTAQHVLPVVYAHAMTAFMALGQPNQAVEVWNTMTAAGVSPSIEHWDAMLKGCGISRDGHAVHDLWARMLAAGTRPDARVWATRIHSLSLCGHLGAAVAAFESMAQQWREAALRQPVPKPRSSHTKAPADDLPPKPNVQCLNAVIASLARARRDDLLSRVLTLARELNIRLDTYTFNPLFRSALRDGNEALGVRLLQRMQHMGIKPDIATFTIMLRAALEDGGTLDWAAVTSDTQGSSVEAKNLGTTTTGGTSSELEKAERGTQYAFHTLFALMEQADIRPTAHTFSTLVAGLLKCDPPHLSAAYAVLRHVTEQDLPLSPQIYTALTSFHFDQNPPDLTSVEALWHHARSQRSRTHPLRLDGFFYDRFIEGWARVGYTERALQAHRTAQRHGVKVGWPYLKRLVSRLVEDGDAEEAQNVAKEAILGFGKENAHSLGLANFIDLCRSLGLELDSIRRET